MCPCSKNDKDPIKVTFGTTKDLYRIIGCYRMNGLFGSLHSLSSWRSKVCRSLIRCWYRFCTFTYKKNWKWSFSSNGHWFTWLWWLDLQTLWFCTIISRPTRGKGTNWHTWWGSKLVKRYISCFSKSFLFFEHQTIYVKVDSLQFALMIELFEVSF